MKVIDLTGPEGNAMYLLGLANKWGRQLEKDVDDITERMMSDDYENLVDVFEEEFGDFCNLYRGDEY